MDRPVFTLLAVVSIDGFLARHPGQPPQGWASAEEQALFFERVSAADWAVMGRGTHEAADRSDRRRVIFSTAAPAPEWRRPSQLWLDPAGTTPAGLAALVAPVRPMREAVILGGARVHDWFRAHGAIDRVELTVEPVRFGTGLPFFAGAQGPAERVLAAAGFRPVACRLLNRAGTRLLTFLPR